MELDVTSNVKLMSIAVEVGIKGNDPAVSRIVGVPVAAICILSALPEGMPLGAVTMLCPVPPV
jgi:hypothetical protein